LEIVYSLLSANHIMSSMKRLQSEVTDEQWNKIKAYLPTPPRGRGGPKPIDNRRCFEGILWTLRSGAAARPANSLSVTKYLLAPIGVLGRRGDLVKCLASATEGDGSKISPELA